MNTELGKMLTEDRERRHENLKQMVDGCSKMMRTALWEMLEHQIHSICEEDGKTHPSEIIHTFHLLQLIERQKSG